MACNTGSWLFSYTTMVSLPCLEHVLRESFLDSLHHSIVIMFRELSVLHKFASANEGRNCLLYGWISWTVIVIVRLSASIVIVKYTLGVVVGNLFFRETNLGLEGTSLVNACPEFRTWVNTWVHTQCKWAISELSLENLPWALPACLVKIA